MLLLVMQMSYKILIGCEICMKQKEFLDLLLGSG